ncbi:MAG: hypothetical protein BACD_02857 [Bacteroides rodentium]
MFRYYSTQRPILPGGLPRNADVERIENFDTKKFCGEIGRKAWGYIDFREDITKEQAEAYELTFGGMKTYWCVTTLFDDKGRVVSAITSTVEAVCKPENTAESTKSKDIYNDWFDSQEEAKEWVEEAKQA